MCENKCEKCRYALKISFIINVCLILLSTIVVVSSLLFAYLETTDIETETITIEGGDTDVVGEAFFQGQP